jgi:heterodisulfide reductase subunit A
MVVQAEDTLSQKLFRVPVDMVVLTPAIEPQADADEVGRKFLVSRGADGFFLEQHPKLAPVSTTTDGVFIAGVCQGPKDIPDTVAQGAATAARVAGLIGRGTIYLEPIRAKIDEEACSGCRICNNLCPYNAITYHEDKKVSEVITALCQGCGTCVAACPSGVITGAHFTNEQIMSELEGILWDARTPEASVA